LKKDHKNCDFKVVQNNSIDREHLVIKLGDDKKLLSMQKFLTEKYKRGNK